MNSLWQDLLLRTKKFDLGLDLYFWKNFTLAKRDRIFILQVCIPFGKTFLLVPKFLTIIFDRLLEKKKLHQSHNFWTKTDRAFIWYMYSCWQDLSVRTKIFDLMTTKEIGKNFTRAKRSPRLEIEIQVAGLKLRGPLHLHFKSLSKVKLFFLYMDHINS